MEITQIQLVPVENGFFIQCVNADGSGNFHPRYVAGNREELVSKLKELADQVYTKEPVRPQMPIPPRTEPVPPDGTAGTKTAA